MSNDDNGFDLETISSSSIEYLDLIDYDDNGKYDILTSYDNSTTTNTINKGIRIRYNSNGTFSNLETIYEGIVIDESGPVWSSHNRIVFEDLNNNSSKDIVYWIGAIDRLGYLDKSGSDIISRVISENSFGIIKVGDFNNNGFKDIIFRDDSFRNISWFENNNNNFNQIILRDINSYSEFPFYDTGLNLIDLNNNGQLDIINGHEILLIEDNKIQNSYPFLLTTSRNRILDYNSNGNLDIVGINGDTGYVHINNGTGTQFAQTFLDLDSNTSFNTTYDNFHIFDLNNNGFFDFLRVLNNKTFIITNNNNNFTSSELNFSKGKIDYADLNNNGYVDIVGDNAIYLNNLDNTFNTITNNEISNISSPSTGDFNNDGFIDIVGYDTELERTVVLYNDGNANFTKEVIDTYQFDGATQNQYQNSKGKYYVVDDIDNDGDMDFILYSTEEIIVYVNDLLELSTIQNEPKLKIIIYPIPTNNKLYIESNDVDVISNYNIYDMSGKKHKASFINGYIDVSKLKKGTYILTYTIENKLYHSKFLKKWF